MAYPRTFVDLRTDVINRLRLDSTADLQKVKDAVNAAYADLCITNEVLQSKHQVTPGAGANYTMTSAAVRIKFIQLSNSGVTYKPMQEVGLDQILSYRAAATSSPTSGPAQFYAFNGHATIEVYPNFAAADTIDIYSVDQPTALSGDSDVPAIPEPYATAIVYGTICELADFVKDPNYLNYQGLYEKWQGKLRVHMNRRKGAGVRQFRVVGQSLFPPHDPSADVR